MFHRGRKIVSGAIRSSKRKRKAHIEDSSLETLERKTRGCALDENNFYMGVTHNGLPIQDLTRKLFVKQNGMYYMSLELAMSLLRSSRNGE